MLESSKTALVREIYEISVRLVNRKAGNPERWEHQQMCKRLVLKGELTEQECETAIALSGSEITRIYPC